MAKWQEIPLSNPSLYSEGMYIENKTKDGKKVEFYKVKFIDLMNSSMYIAKCNPYVVRIKRFLSRKIVKIIDSVMSRL